MKTADQNHRCMRLSSAARLPHFGGGVALLVLALLAVSPAFGQDLSPGSRPLGFERAAFDLDRFAEQSDVIVRGIVSSKEPKWVGRVLYTHYDLVVQETIHGQAQSSITVAVLGGTVGNIQLAVPHTPNLNVGDEIIFFGQSFEGQPSFKPVGLGAGVVSVTPGSGGSGVPTVAPRGKSESLENFLDEVRSSRHNEEHFRRRNEEQSRGRL